MKGQIKALAFAFCNDEGERPGFISPDLLDFDIPGNLPLPKSFILKNKNIKFLLILRNNPNYICIGNFVYNGLVTEHYSYIPVKDFTLSCALFGKSGTGKTYLSRRCCPI